MDSSIGIADLAAILTTVGVTIYVLGLIGLAMPISRTFTSDLSTAWYAVSLLPRTIVAGQGVRIWVQLPLFWTVLLVPSMWLAPGGGQLGEDLAGDGFKSVRGLLDLGGLVWVAVLATCGYAYYLHKRHGQRRWIILTSALLVFIGIAIMEASLVFAAVLPLTYEALVYFIGSFLAGLPSAFRANPPLPKVEITKEAVATMAGNSKPIEVEGHLITHSDGFWHLFDSNKELLSIPDAHVLEVRTFGRHSRPSTEQRRKLEEDGEPDMEKTTK